MWAGSGEGDGGEEEGGGGRVADTPTHLRELLKTEREQKVCKNVLALLHFSVVRYYNIMWDPSSLINHEYINEH